MPSPVEQAVTSKHASNSLIVKSFDDEYIFRYFLDHYIFMLLFVLLLLLLLLLLSSFFPRLISAAADWMSAILPHIEWH